MTARAPGDKMWSDRDAQRFVRFFEQATGFRPYPYQIRMALMPGLPRFVRVHTGAGKTAAAALAWLWRRRFAADAVRSATPRRLVYCLPGRGLVEQTRDNVVQWLFNLGLLGGAAQIDDSGPKDRVCRYEPGWDAAGLIAVSVTAGGADGDGWDIHPERDAVLVGTQDMLLSRALNRGYGMSRYRRPLHFGLLNNDSLWVFDEVQLMGEGLPTTAQLDAFREKSGHFGPTATIWMGSELDPEWLRTADFEPGGDGGQVLTLGDEDRAAGALRERMAAGKPVARARPTMGDIALAGEIISRHLAGTRTLAVVNTVERALALYRAIAKRKPPARLVLVHSRFRPPDRLRALQALLGEPGPSGTIAVSTHVIEAGADVSARLLFTELAPWDALVQRFGRCNRTGAEKNPRIFWVDLPADDRKRRRMALPYELEDLLRARKILAGVSDASPSSLPDAPTPRKKSQLLRRRDITDLFDTAPELSGPDADVSRYIRSGPETDVSVFWRDLPPEGPGLFDRFPGRDELCPVPAAELRDLIAGRCIEAWAPDQLDGAWTPLSPETHLPFGMTILLRSQAGMYSEETGWDVSSTRPVPPVAAEKRKDSVSYDEDTFARTAWATIAAHSDEVVRAVRILANGIEGVDCWLPALLEAARWHDAGKAHTAFQAKLRLDGMPDSIDGPAAKAPEDAWLPPLVPDSPRDGGGRLHFRHELASGLLALQAGRDDLVAYLAAAHHGKVRMSLRALPDEWRPPEEGRRYARGVWEGDDVGEVDLGRGTKSRAARLDLGLMDLGDGPRGPSWTARVLALRDRPDLGIFRLAFLEALLKSADERASGGTV
jgi:CRISPR-associated endonuclease/helicase Cas3